MLALWTCNASPFWTRWLEALSYHMAHGTSMEIVTAGKKHCAVTANSFILLVGRISWCKNLKSFAFLLPRQLIKSQISSVNFRKITCLPCISCTHAFTASSCVLGVESRHLQKACGSIIYMRLADCWLCMRDERFSLHYEVSMFSAQCPSEAEGSACAV